MTQHLNQHLPRMINHQTIGLWDDDGNFLHLTKIYTTTRLPAGDCPMDFGVEEEHVYVVKDDWFEYIRTAYLRKCYEEWRDL